jgi:hypothetical protein
MWRLQWLGRVFKARINATVSVPNTSLAMSSPPDPSVSLSQKRPRNSSRETGGRNVRFPPGLGLRGLIVAFQQRPWIMLDVAYILVFVSKAVRVELRNNGQPFCLAPKGRHYNERLLLERLPTLVNEWACHITTIDLSNPLLTAVGYTALLNSLAACSHLVTVNLAQAPPFVNANHDMHGSPEMQVFRAGVGQLTPVRVISFAHWDLHREESYGYRNLFEAMSTMTFIRKIILDHCNIDRSGFIYELRELPNLEELSLIGNRLDQARPIARSWRPDNINQGPNWPRLEVLNLRDNQIGLYGPHGVVNFMLEVQHMPCMRTIVLARSGQFQVYIPNIFQYVLDHNMFVTHPFLGDIEEVENKPRTLRVLQVEYLV